MKTELTTRGAAREAERYQDVVIQASRCSSPGHAVVSAAFGVERVGDALRQATRAALGAKLIDGSDPWIHGYRSALDSLECAVRAGIETRGVAEVIIARFLGGGPRSPGSVNPDVPAVGPQDYWVQPTAALRTLMDAADSLLADLLSARQVLDVPEGLGRTRRSAVTRAKAAARAADGHAQRAERLAHCLVAVCPENPAFARAHAQLARAEIERSNALLSGASRDQRESKIRAGFRAALAEAYEQVARTCAAVTGARFAAERVDLENMNTAIGVRDQAIELIEECAGLSGEAEAGGMSAIDTIRLRAGQTERLEDELIAMLHPDPQGRTALHGAGGYALLMS